MFCSCKKHMQEVAIAREGEHSTRLHDNNTALHAACSIIMHESADLERQLPVRSGTAVQSTQTGIRSVPLMSCCSRTSDYFHVPWEE